MPACYLEKVKLKYQQALCTEPFGNYILEGFVSISACKFEAAPDARTAEDLLPVSEGR